MEQKHLAVMIRERVKKYGARAAMRYKDRVSGQWKEISWRALGEQINAIGKALMEMGVEEGDMVGIFSQNRPEWAVTDFGAQSIRAVSVPIYPTSTSMQARYIVNDAAIKVLFAGDRATYERARSILDSSKRLQKIVVFDGGIDAQGDERVLHFGDLLELGKRSDKDTEINARLSRGATGDLATVVYTSGTTGAPKGVMLAHSNFFHQIDGVGSLLDVSERDVSLCFLPLSHVLERSWSYYVLHQGAVNSYCDEPRKILDYLREAKPTIMVCVPRLFEKIHASVLNRLKGASPSKRKLFNWAMAVGMEFGEHKRAKKPVGLRLKLKHSLASPLVLKRMQAILGGRIRFLVSGGAPLSKEIEEFFYAAGMLICQGYGLTETTAPVTLNTPTCFKFGTVGRVEPGCEVKISEEGEILIKGGNVMSGYLGMQGQTAEAFVEGWLKTGDVGEFDEEGFLRITDRIKDLIVTSVGNNIWPQPIETILSKDPFIDQIVVIGDRRKFLSALIVPAFEALEDYAKFNNITFESRQELVRHPDIRAFYEKRIQMQSVSFSDYDRIRKISLVSHELTQEADEITPTQKIKRKVIDKKYADIIEAMYTD